MGRYLEAVRADVRRGGKPAARRRHLDRLTAMRDRLASRHANGHDTLDAALRELASLILSDRPSRMDRRAGGGARVASNGSQQRRPLADEVALYTIHGTPGSRRPR